MKFTPLSKIKILLCLIWLVLFVAGLIVYTGSKILYIGFSLVFLALLLSGFYRQLGYGYLFLSVFLWLGFWFKLTVNFLIFGYFPFGEPVGMFDSSPAAWDIVLWVAVFAALGTMMGRFIYGLFKPLRTCTFNEVATAPAWYFAWRKLILIAVTVACLTLAAINSIYGIHQIGLSPRTILPWPMNALISWFVSIGSAMSISMLLIWEFQTGKKPILLMYLVLIEGVTATVSLLSRGIYLFHTIPQLILIFGIKKIGIYTFNRSVILLFFAAFTFSFVVSLATVSLLRDHYYTNVPSTVPSWRPALLHQLFVNRWIGLEGVMAVSAYPQKSRQLLMEMATEKRKVGEPTRYQSISNSLYQDSNSQYQFASLPGIAAFLYYSGSFLFVLMGTFIVALVLMCCECCIFSLTRNPFLCSLLGLSFANLICQFGITPRQDLPYVSMTIGAVLGIALLQSQFLNRVLTRS